MSFRLLAVLPFIGILLGVPFVNRVEPLVLGMPLVLAWIVLWVLLTPRSWRSSTGSTLRTGTPHEPGRCAHEHRPRHHRGRHAVRACISACAPAAGTT